MQAVGLIAGVLALAPLSAFAQVNVRALSVGPEASGVAGQSIDIVASFISDDAQPMPAFRWRPYLTVGGVLDGAIPLGVVGPITLSGSAPQVFTVSRVLPANVSGHFTVAIVADFDGVVNESNEYDNIAIASGTTHVIGQSADLDLVNASANQTERRASEPISVSFAIRNVGELNASVTVGAYLSNDAVISPSDLLLGTTSVNVAAGGSVNGSISGAVPADAAVGDYTIGLIADPDGLVTERDEANNILGAARLNVFEDALALDTETLPEGTLTIPYHVQLDSSGGDGNYAYAVVAGSLPNGLTLDASGTLQGTPVRTGTFEFEIEVTSRGLSDRRAYRVEVVSTFQPLRIATESIGDGFHRYPYQQVLVAGGGEAPYMWRLADGTGALPPGLDLSTSGVISGIPDQLGHFSFGVVVEDRLGAIDMFLYEVDIVPLATVLIQATENPSGFVGQALDYELQAVGGIPPYRWQAASTPPPGLTVTEDGRLAGTPEQVGVWPLRVRVTDSTTNGVSDTALFQVEIQDDGALVVLTETLPPGLVRSKFEVAIEVEGGDAPYTWTLGPGESLPDGFFLNEQGVIIGRAFRPMVHGFSVVVEDARGRSQQVPYAIVIESGNGSLGDGGCVCVGSGFAASRPESSGFAWPQPSSGLALLLLGLVLIARRKREVGSRGSRAP
jgi:hypothetical protein